MGLEEGKGAVGLLSSCHSLCSSVPRGAKRGGAGLCRARELPGAGCLCRSLAGQEAESRAKGAAPGCQMSVSASDQQEGLHLNQQELSGLRTMAGGYF